MGVEQRKNQVAVLVPLVSFLGLSFQKVHKRLIYIIKKYNNKFQKNQNASLYVKCTYQSTNICHIDNRVLIFC